MELPRAEMKSSFGVRLETRLKRFWFVYLVISVISIGYAAPWFVIPWVMSIGDGEHESGGTPRVLQKKTEADDLRNRVSAFAPERRAKHWDSNLFFIRRAAERGDRSVTREILGLGPRGGDDMNWFLARLTEEGIKYEWTYHPDVDSRHLTMSW